MSATGITELYDTLASKLGKETAKNLITFMKQETKSEMENTSKILATKDELYKVKDDLKNEISKVKFDLIIWIVGSWITLAGLILGLHFTS
jgi:hypothetical protein